MRVHDEVCGMTIESEAAAAKTEFQGKTYYFCSQRCKRMFTEHPERFVAVREERNRAGAK